MFYVHMDNTKDVGSINRPLVLDGTHYDYWKANMVAFLKFMDNKTWKVIIRGWKHPMNVSQDGTSSLNLEAERTGAKDN